MNQKQANTHVWKLAEVVHPRGKVELVEWVQKVLTHYEIKATTIDGYLSEEQAYLLWTCLLALEIERSDKFLEQIRREAVV